VQQFLHIGHFYRGDLVRHHNGRGRTGIGAEPAVKKGLLCILDNFFRR
jgi:hypothetical protein